MKKIAGLEPYLRNRMKKRDILLMTHIVVGHPSFSSAFMLVRTMVNAGVDLMELQIPCPEPVADGPVIARANREAIKQGAGVERCLDFAKKVVHSFDIPFLIMTYWQVPLSYGVTHFVSAMAHKGLKGAIIPDLPPEEGPDYLKAMQTHDLSPILIFSPTTSGERMRQINAAGRGFIYCVARKGVTGAKTALSKDLTSYLGRCRTATRLPIAVGFGIKDRADVDFLKGKADIAVVGTRILRMAEEQGIPSVGPFIRGLRT